MKGNKLIFCTIGALIAVLAAVTAIIIFKNEIIDFFADVKEKIDDKRITRHGEFADYADM